MVLCATFDSALASRTELGIESWEQHLSQARTVGRKQQHILPTRGTRLGDNTGSTCLEQRVLLRGGGVAVVTAGCSSC